MKSTIALTIFLLAVGEFSILRQQGYFFTLISTNFTAVSATVVPDDCAPRNCGINPQYYWNTELCKCLKSCYPITQKTCGNPLRFKLNPVTCKCQRFCPPRNCGINPQFYWNSVTCRCEFRRILE